MTPVQRSRNGVMNTPLIAKHVIVPEAYNAVALSFDDTRAGGVHLLGMLTAIHFNHELCSMAGKVCDEVADRDLAPEMLVREGQAKQSPQSTLRWRRI